VTKLTGAALDKAVANVMGIKSVHNCEKWKGGERTWVGLTDDEHCDIWYKESLDWMEYGKAIEANLKQKNGFAEEKNT
jgi:hypothetical protein